MGEDGRRIDLRVLIRNPKTGEWHLNKPNRIWPQFSDHSQVVHLSWSHMGNDLAVVDSAGRMLIYSTGFSLAQMVLIRGAVGEPDSEMNALVGLHWLSVFPHTQKVGWLIYPRSLWNYANHFFYFQSGTFWAASRNNDEWRVRSTHHLSPGPYNPFEGKSALICLSRNGLLRLLYQQRNSSWTETSYQLEDASSAVSYSFTHASFAPDNGKLLQMYF